VKNELRIIGGTWRSRKLRFPDAPGLRPTPDRLRETLFNWLRQGLHGLRCLDLYAGSGALGFEAASRGAARVVMVESNKTTFTALKDNCSRLDAAQVSVAAMDVSRFLDGPPESFDVVFLDPPFHQGLVVPGCRKLTDSGWLADGARIYVETERSLDLGELPSSWLPLRDKQAGEVACRLYQYRQSGLTQQGI
jgi:16S rRNA (guanine966-N2)-methyltransferase